MKKLSFLLILIAIIGCKQNNSEERIPVEPDQGIGDGATPPPALSFSENIEEAHNKPAFMNREAVKFDIDLKFGGETRLKGRISMTTNSSKVRLDKEDGSAIIYDGNKVYLTPASSDSQGARFDIFTWQYFFAMPFKLTDPGTVWEEQESKNIDSTSYETAKLSFKGNIGDSPDDWYIVYKDRITNRLKAAAYIVTFSKDQATAEKNPHAIVYSDYKTFENVAMATRWSFHNWNKENGMGEKLGEATISNLEFFDPEKAYFKAPKNGKIVEK